jgi:hypothetical protein
LQRLGLPIAGGGRVVAGERDALQPDLGERARGVEVAPLLTGELSGGVTASNRESVPVWYLSPGRSQ